MLNSALMQQQAYQQYQRVQTQTASPGQLLILLYEGGLRFIGRGRAALEVGDWDTARVNLLRAQDIVAELMGSLNFEAGDVATNLLRLYEYMHRRLVIANIHRDAAAAAEVDGLLRTLLPAWEEAVRQQTQASPAPAAPVPAGAPINAGPDVATAFSPSALAAARRPAPNAVG
jgi:flagellar protein FliS